MTGAPSYWATANWTLWSSPPYYPHLLSQLVGCSPHKSVVQPVVRRPGLQFHVFCACPGAPERSFDEA